MVILNKLTAAVVLINLNVQAAVGFTTTKTAICMPNLDLQRSHRSLHELCLGMDSDSSFFSGRSGFPIDDGWKLKNDFSIFLNQCSIQTFYSVLKTIRDPHTVRWMDNFTQSIIPAFDSNARASSDDTGSDNVETSRGIPYSSKLLTYHGLGAINTTLYPTWESYFAILLEQPTEHFLIQSGGLQMRDYELDINPASICTRLISIREQIAEEFANDLGVLAHTMGQHTMDSYYDLMEDIGLQKTKDRNNNGRRLPPHNLVFLGYALDPIDGFTPSPLRQHNFDLAVLLATQESIHRLLNKHCNDNGPHRQYLLDFYVERLESHFTGTQRYGRADDFLEELLFGPPRQVSVVQGEGTTVVVDPVRVAEWILQERREVALEWQSACKNIPSKDHIQIKRLQLDRLMQSYNSNT